MHRWTVGTVEITRIEDIDFALPAEPALPDWTVPSVAPSPDEYRVAFSALGIADGDALIVADPWLQAERSAPDAAERASRLLAELEAAGFPAGAVATVVNSHLDGMGWNTRSKGPDTVLSFPNAHYLYPADEVDALAGGALITGHEDFAHLRTLTDVDAVGDQRSITPSVSVERAPGHSAGHQVVRIESGGDLAIYLGHLVLHPRQIAFPNEIQNESAALEATTRTRYLDELAQRRGLLLTTLVGGAGGGRVERDGDGYRLSA